MRVNREQALHFVKPHLNTERFEHTIRVTDTAIQLTERFGGDVEQAELAGILHDYAKYRDREEMRRWILQDHRLPKDLLSHHHGLWHGPVGAVMLEFEYGLEDREVSQAIACHTTGKKNMSHLDKIIFLADYIEPGRTFPGVEEVRKTAESDLNKACLAAASNTITFLMNKHQPVYPDTFHAYNNLQNIILNS
ncbi:bis(5'-nucleosyl)-tetraphosphatase (symmetrical) YqeK [Thalassobacillus sp. CUG 92003]|uniref:bis(5'-nucleosyl)-tetraphosphatase (symmetrical) YqeK n=1 Tax=Thalassobacillus sp. CUG 92003 TaxID=2736641 RepID=UPI0015E6AF17|nr:bis(5'-nucleosyl)-tetraphosphatase (symmetrical) YqeK [Thalassobacillus sp. CUG 92003]